MGRKTIKYLQECQLAKTNKATNGELRRLRQLYDSRNEGDRELIEHTESAIILHIPTSTAVNVTIEETPADALRDVDDQEQQQQQQRLTSVCIGSPTVDGRKCGKTRKRERPPPPGKKIPIGYLRIDNLGNFDQLEIIPIEDAVQIGGSTQRPPLPQSATSSSDMSTPTNAGRAARASVNGANTSGPSIPTTVITNSLISTDITTTAQSEGPRTSTEFSDHATSKGKQRTRRASRKDERDIVLSLRRFFRQLRMDEQRNGPPATASASVADTASTAAASDTLTTELRISFATASSPPPLSDVPPTDSTGRPCDGDASTGHASDCAADDTTDARDCRHSDRPSYVSRSRPPVAAHEGAHVDPEIDYEQLTFDDLIKFDPNRPQWSQKDGHRITPGDVRLECDQQFEVLASAGPVPTDCRTQLPPAYADHTFTSNFCSNMHTCPARPYCIAACSLRAHLASCMSPFCERQNCWEVSQVIGHWIHCVQFSCKQCSPQTSTAARSIMEAMQEKMPHENSFWYMVQHAQKSLDYYFQMGAQNLFIAYVEHFYCQSFYAVEEMRGIDDTAPNADFPSIKVKAAVRHSKNCNGGINCSFLSCSRLKAAVQHWTKCGGLCDTNLCGLCKRVQIHSHKLGKGYAIAELWQLSNTYSDRKAEELERILCGMIRTIPHVQPQNFPWHVEVPALERQRLINSFVDMCLFTDLSHLDKEIVINDDIFTASFTDQLEIGSQFILHTLAKQVESEIFNTATSKINYYESLQNIMNQILNAYYEFMNLKIFIHECLFEKGTQIFTKRSEQEISNAETEGMFELDKDKNKEIGKTETENVMCTTRKTKTTERMKQQQKMREK